MTEPQPQVCLPAVGLVGVLGNLGAILILRRPEMKSTFHHTLITLAVTDILFLITLVVDTQRLDLDLKNQVFIMLFPYFWNPAKNILLTFETFLMMSITTERYLAIRNPLQHRFSRFRSSPSVHLTAYILPPLLASVILNIPKFFETELVTIEIEDDNGSTVQLVDYNITSLRFDPSYILYYIHWTRLLTTGLLPFAYLLVTNLLLVSSLRSIAKLRLPHQNVVQHEINKHGLRVHRASLQVQPARARDSSSSLLLMAVVVIYLVCSLPRHALNLTEYLLQVHLSRHDVVPFPEYS